MKIAILGGTGQTGQQLVQQALDDGHDVIAIVRTPSKLNIVHDRLTIVIGSIFSDEDLKKHFQDVEVVMSTIGFSIYPRTVTGYSEAIKCAVKAMREVGCKRLIIVHTWYTEKQSRNDGAFLVRWIMIPLMAPLLDDMRVTEEYLEAECGDIDYTVVSPPELRNTSKTDAEYHVAENAFDIPGASLFISRADVARYMLKIIQAESSYKKIQMIAVKT